jgi:UDP-N-acetylmuramyl pentapeptide phosphotransferase/UDP-N-acetylglucosamine-1-phosphate transferase
VTLVGAAIAASLVSAVTTCVLSGLIAWAGPVDPPGSRTSHKRPTPTSGGLAMLAGAGLGAIFFARLRPEASGLAPVAATLALGGVLGAMAALDDLYDFGAKAKLLAQALAGLVFAIFVARIEVLPLGVIDLPLGPVIGALGTALWIVVATNAVNFMDGANGVAPGAQVISLFAFALAAFGAGLPVIGGTALAGAAACAGFLPWNLGGKLFQGDVGALFSSFVLAGLAVLATASGRGHGTVFVYFAPLALFPFLTDVLLTLLVRARRGERLFEAHRDHLYQLWLKQRPDRRHLALAVRTGAIMALYAGLALILQHMPPAFQAPAFAAIVAATSLIWTATRRRLER